MTRTDFTFASHTWSVSRPQWGGFPLMSEPPQSKFRWKHIAHPQEQQCRGPREVLGYSCAPLGCRGGSRGVILAGLGGCCSLKPSHDSAADVWEAPTAPCQGVAPMVLMHGAEARGSWVRSRYPLCYFSFIWLLISYKSSQ